MRVCILMGSPRMAGNTAFLLKHFEDELKALGVEYDETRVYEKNILPCLACRECQKDWSAPACCQKDDCAEIFQRVLESDVLVLATPIYAWYCTAPLKALMDRMVYAFNKYYLKEKGPSLWSGKKVASIVSCGYPVEKGADIWEEGLKRYCKHSELEYIGMAAERHLGYSIEFKTEDKIQRIKDFAKKIAETEEI